MCLFKDDKKRPLSTAFLLVSTPKDCVIQNTQHGPYQVIHNSGRNT